MFSNFSKALKKTNALTVKELAHVFKEAHTPSPAIHVIHYVADFKAWCKTDHIKKLILSQVCLFLLKIGRLVHLNSSCVIIKFVYVQWSGHSMTHGFQKQKVNWSWKRFHKAALKMSCLLPLIWFVLMYISFLIFLENFQRYSRLLW